MIRISGRVTGSEAVRAKLAAVRAEIPEALSRERLGGLLLRRMRDRFRRQIDPDGVRWPELAPTSKKGKRVLSQTGALEGAIDILTGVGGLGTATGAGFRIGVKSKPYTQLFEEGGSRRVDPAKYGRLHQRGLGVKRRRFLGIGATDRKAVSDFVRRELRKAVSVTP